MPAGPPAPACKARRRIPVRRSGLALGRWATRLASGGLLCAALLCAAVIPARAQDGSPAQSGSPVQGSTQTQAGPAAPAPLPAPQEPGVAELTFIERLYRQGDAYRAESEALRFVHQRPRHPQRPQVELARAKLYYRDGRYDEASRALYSLLDRHPRSAASDDARTLLTFAHLRRGDLARARESAADARMGEALAALAEPPAGLVDEEAAERWSTWLPGSGYVLLDAPGKAAAGFSLNVALVGAAVVSAQAGNAPAAALFAVLEAMLWQGGRHGVRQEAEAYNRRLRERRLEQWLNAHGEPELLGIGLALRFGGGEAPGAAPAGGIRVVFRRPFDIADASLMVGRLDLDPSPSLPAATDAMNAPFRLAIATAVVLACAGAGPAAAQQLCVKASRANLRAGPGTDNRITWEVNRFMPLIQVGTEGDWIKVKDVDGDLHWVYGALVTDKFDCVTISSPKANIRKKPSTRSDKWFTVEKYTSFKRVGGSEKWVKIEYEGETMWVYETLVWPG